MKINRLRSLQFKLTLWYIVILTILIAIIGSFIYHGIKRSLLGDVHHALERVAQDVFNNSFNANTHEPNWWSGIAAAEKNHGSGAVWIQIVTFARDKSKFVEQLLCSQRISGAQFLLPKEIYAELERAEKDEQYRIFTFPQLSGVPMCVGFFEMRGPRLLQIGILLSATTAKLRQTFLLLACAGLLLLLFSSLGGSFIIRRALQPVQSVVNAARHISADDLTMRISARGRNDEIGALIDTFNDMIARLEKSVDQIKRFTADVSHELRTPLTIIRGELEVCLRKPRTNADYQHTLVSTLEETAHLEQIIADLLFLSRIDAARKNKPQLQVMLDEVVLRVFEQRQPLARQASLRFHLDRVDAAACLGDATLLERLVVNVMDNAIRYTPAGGAVTVQLLVENGSAVLTVRDTGCGIPTAALPHIFERFYVAEPSRSKEKGGVGLGLSIVQSIADLHQATIAVASDVGHGTSFSITFPAVFPA